MNTQAQREAKRRYNQKHKDEINRRSRERYKRVYQQGLITVQMVQAEERRINPPPVHMKRTHKGYPPDGVCPCPECRAKAQASFATGD